MNIKTEKEDLIKELNRANKLCEEATLNYMNMCKQVEVLEKCLNEIKELLFADACAKCPYGEEVVKKCERNIEPCVLRLKGNILHLIKQAKETNEKQKTNDR